MSQHLPKMMNVKLMAFLAMNMLMTTQETIQAQTTALAMIQAQETTQVQTTALATIQAQTTALVVTQAQEMTQETRQAEQEVAQMKAQAMMALMRNKEMVTVETVTR